MSLAPEVSSETAPVSLPSLDVPATEFLSVQETCIHHPRGQPTPCHRYSSAQHSRHIDRKLFKMRELRGAGRVTIKHIPGEENPADLFTKILSRQPFEKHRKFVLNTPGDAGIESSRQRRAGADASSQRHGTGAP